MSGRVRERSKSKHRKDDGGSKPRVGARHPRDEKPKKKEAPPQNRDMKPDQGKAEGGAPVAQGRDLEADLQELPQAKAGGVPEDDSDAKERNPPCLKPVKMPEAGEGQPQI